jgi:zinc/manganese transport system ATP-binding protein
VSAIELINVILAFGRRTILSNVTLAIRDDEFVSVLGPNGSGKTTLMCAILGLVVFAPESVG